MAPQKPCVLPQARNPFTQRCGIPKPEWATAAAAAAAPAAPSYAPRPPPPPPPLLPSVKEDRYRQQPQIDAAIDARVARIERASEADLSKLQTQMEAHAASIDARVARIERAAETDAGRSQQMMDAHIATTDGRVARIERIAESDSAKLRQLETESVKRDAELAAAMKQTADGLDTTAGTVSDHQVALVDLAAAMKQTSDGLEITKGTVTEHQVALVEMAAAMKQTADVLEHTKGTVTDLDRRTQSLFNTVTGLSDNAAVLASAIDGLRPAAAAAMPVTKTPSPVPALAPPPPPAAKRGFLTRASDRLMRLVGRRGKPASSTLRRNSPLSVVIKSARRQASSASMLPSAKAVSMTARRSMTPQIAKAASMTARRSMTPQIAKAASMTDSVRAIMAEKARRAKAMAELQMKRKPVSATARKSPSAKATARKSPSAKAVVRRPAFLNDIAQGAKLKKPVGEEAGPVPPPPMPQRGMNMLDQIKQGRDLKPVQAMQAPPPPPPPPPQRGMNMLDQIKQGRELKPVQAMQAPPPPPPQRGMNMLDQIKQGRELKPVQAMQAPPPPPPQRGMNMLDQIKQGRELKPVQKPAEAMQAAAPRAAAPVGLLGAIQGAKLRPAAERQIAPPAPNRTGIFNTGVLDKIAMRRAAINGSSERTENDFDNSAISGVAGGGGDSKRRRMY